MRMGGIWREWTRPRWTDNIISPRTLPKQRSALCGGPSQLDPIPKKLFSGDWNLIILSRSSSRIAPHLAPLVPTDPTRTPVPSSPRPLSLRRPVRLRIVSPPLRLDLVHRETTFLLTLLFPTDPTRYPVPSSPKSPFLCRPQRLRIVSPSLRLDLVKRVLLALRRCRLERTFLEFRTNRLRVDSTLPRLFPDQLQLPSTLLSFEEFRFRFPTPRPSRPAHATTLSNPVPPHLRFQQLQQLIASQRGQLPYNRIAEGSQRFRSYWIPPRKSTMARSSLRQGARIMPLSPPRSPRRKLIGSSL